MRRALILSSLLILVAASPARSQDAGKELGRRAFEAANQNGWESAAKLLTAEPEPRVAAAGWLNSVYRRRYADTAGRRQPGTTPASRAGVVSLVS